MGEKDCLECKLTPICKMYDALCNLCDEGAEFGANKIDDGQLGKVVACNCDYHDHKAK